MYRIKLILIFKTGSRRIIFDSLFLSVIKNEDNSNDMKANIAKVSVKASIQEENRGNTPKKGILATIPIKPSASWLSSLFSLPQP